MATRTKNAKKTQTIQERQRQEELRQLRAELSRARGTIAHLERHTAALNESIASLGANRDKAWGERDTARAERDRAEADLAHLRKINRTLLLALNAALDDGKHNSLIDGPIGPIGPGGSLLAAAHMLGVF